MRLKDFIYGFIIAVVCIFLSWIEGADVVIDECKSNPEFLKLMVIIIIGIFVLRFLTIKIERSKEFLKKQIFYGAVIVTIYLVMCFAIYNFLSIS